MKIRSLSLFLALSLTLLTSSCKTESAGGAGPQPSATTGVASASDVPTASSGGESSGQPAEKWNGKLDELLTLEMAAETSGFPSGEAEVDYNKVLKSPETHSVRYGWQKGRVQMIQNPVTKSEMKVPVEDSVELSWVRSTTLDKFKANYHTPTAQELAQADAAIENKVGEMQAEGRVSQQQAESAKGMASSLGKGLSYDEVSGVGDYAVWNNKHKELKVFYQGLEFQVRTVLSDEEAVNREKAVEVAQKIINEKLKS